MKILFVLELFYPNIGGNEKLFKTLGESMVRQGHEVTVITTRFNRSLSKTETLNGMLIRRIPLISRFMFTFFGLFYLPREARKADLIHTTSYNAALPARIAAFMSRKPCIITFHEVWGNLWFKLPYLNLAERLLFYSYEQFILRLGFKKYIGVSEFTKNRLLKNGIGKSRVMCIHNGLEYTGYKKQHTPPENKFIYTYFGRLGSSKGLDLILASATSFLSSPGRKLNLIIPRQPGALYQTIIKTITRNKLDGRIDIHHELPEHELNNILITSSCVVIPSYSEGFCFAAAEAVAMGIPVVSSGNGALAEVVSGKHINMDEMTPQGLTRALEKAEKGLWDETPAKMFELSDTVKKYQKLYSGLLS